MDLTSLIGPAVVAAAISGLVSSIGIWISARTTRAIHAEKLAFDREQGERRTTAEIAQAERRLTADIALAERKLAAEQALASWKRRTELAEEVLTDFYQARDIIHGARLPIGFGDEGNTRPREEWETEGDTRMLDTYFRTAERLNKKQEFFAQMAARKHRFAALFGRESLQPFDTLWQIRGEIIVAVQMLLLMHRHRASGMGTDDQKAWETTIGWAHTSPDPIQARLDRVVLDIEQICHPAAQDISR